MGHVFTPQSDTAQIERAGDDQGVPPRHIVDSTELRRVKDIGMRWPVYDPLGEILNDRLSLAGFYEELSGGGGIELG